MTLRAVLLGLLGAAFICGVTYFNDAVMHQTQFIGNNMPISVYGLTILLLVVINPFLAWLRPRLALSGREIAVMLALTLAACCIPGSGLMRTFTSSLIMALWIGLLGLALVVHRQWSDHEQLPYPIAIFTNTLLPNEGEVVAPIFRNRLFWIGMGAVMLIHLNNYACLWYPKMIAIPVTLDFMGLNALFPTFVKGGGESLLTPTLYFTVIAFAYTSCITASRWAGHSRETRRSRRSAPCVCSPTDFLC